MIAGVSGSRIQIVRISSSGVMLPPVTIEDGGTASVAGVTVASTGSELLVAWKYVYPGPMPFASMSVSLQVRTVSADATVVASTIDSLMDEQVGRFAGTTDPPALVSNGHDVLLAWTEGTSLLGDAARNLFAILLHPGESLTKAEIDQRKRIVPSEFAPQIDVTSARNGDSLLFAWSESFSPDPSGNVDQQIVFARVTAGMEQPDGPGVILAPDESQPQVYPSAAWDGHRTWIAWSTAEKGIRASFVQPDGSRSPAPAVISDGGMAPRMACSEDACLMVWSDNTQLFAARLEHGAVVDEGGFPLGTAHSYVVPGDFDVATDGSRFVVVWADRFPNGGALLHSILFGPLDAGITTHEGDLAATNSSYLTPRIAWNGREYDILWTEYDPLKNQSILRGSRVSADDGSFDGDRTGWRGVAIREGTLGEQLTSLAAPGDFLDVTNNGNDLLRLDPATFAVLDTIHFAGVELFAAALDAGPMFLARAPADFGLLIRRLEWMRPRSVRH